MIRVSRSLKDTARQICAAREALEKEEGREPDVEELAERLGTDREEIVLAIESAAEVESLHAATVSEGWKCSAFNGQN